LRRAGLRLGRGPLDAARRDRRVGPGAGTVRRSVRALRLARRGRVRQQALVRHAARLRRPPREAGMTLAPEQELENPLLEALGIGRTPESCALVIFGASGDLTHKKLFPALYSLAFRHLLPRNFAVLGVARTEGSDDQFREDLKADAQEHGRDPFRDDVWETLAQGMRYLDMDFGDDASWTK